MKALWWRSFRYSGCCCAGLCRRCTTVQHLAIKSEHLTLIKMDQVKKNCFSFIRTSCKSATCEVHRLSRNCLNAEDLITDEIVFFCYRWLSANESWCKPLIVLTVDLQSDLIALFMRCIYCQNSFWKCHVIFNFHTKRYGIYFANLFRQPRRIYV